MLTAVFYFLAALTVAAGFGVVFTANVVHSALALMGTRLGVAVVLVVLTAVTHAITTATSVSAAPAAPKPTVYGIGSR